MCKWCILISLQWFLNIVTSKYTNQWLLNIDTYMCFCFQKSSPGTLTLVRCWQLWNKPQAEKGDALLHIELSGYSWSFWFSIWTVKACPHWTSNAHSTCIGCIHTECALNQSGLNAHWANPLREVVWIHFELDRLCAHEYVIANFVLYMCEHGAKLQVLWLRVGRWKRLKFSSVFGDRPTFRMN